MKTYWSLVVTGSLLCAGGLAGCAGSRVTGTAVPTESARPTYESMSQVAVAAASSGAQGFPRITMQHYADLATSSEVLGHVLASTGLPLTSRQLKAEISAFVPAGTTLITITVKDPSALRAQLIAAAEADQLVQSIDSLQSPGSTSTPTVKALVVQPATVGSQVPHAAMPIRPSRGSLRDPMATVRAES